jgi:hypothetical protein
MNHFRALLYSSAVLAFLVLAAAVQPANAQLEQAKHIHHRLLPAGDTCATCHKAIYDQWKAGPHGTNGIECTICHGETTAADFAGTPGLSTCETCHSDQVASLKSDPFLKGKTCVNCHQAHVFVAHKKAAPESK